MKSAEQLRATLVALDSQLESARANFVASQLNHRAALRSEIETGKKDVSSVTASALQAAQDEHARVLLACDMAKEMHAQALERERLQAEAEARDAVEARIERMGTLAREADESFAIAVGRLRALYAAEVETHRAVRDAFGRAPWLAPRTLTAVEALAGFLRSLASGNPQDMKPWIEETTNSASKNIRDAVQP